MSPRATNLALLVLVGALVASGLVAWTIPEIAAAPLYGAHRVLGLALVLAIVAKYAIARDSLRRRLPSGVTPAIALSAVTTVALAATLALGLGWTLGLLSFDAPWGYSALNVHVLVGLGLFVLVLAHSAIRWQRRPPVARLATRRAALRLAGIGGAALVLVPLLGRFADERRVTGSKHAGSFTANAFPLTIWNFDAVPEIDPSAWRLAIGGAVAAPLSVSYAELLRAPARDVVAIIDCTGGWWSEQRWHGARVADLLARSRPLASATEATVISVTGHRWTFALDGLGDAILATHVGGETLAVGHGFPARLVAPDRRGFQWIKWVERIEVG